MLGALLQRTSLSTEQTPWQRTARALWGGNLPLTQAQGSLLAKLMLLPSVAFLLFALAYLAQFSDLIGTLAPHAALQRFARHGQWLGAAALALLVVSCLLRKAMRLKWGFGRTLLWVLITCASSLYLGYHAQRLLVDGLVERASPSQQAQAAFGIPLLNRMLEHGLRLDGQATTAKQLHSPQGKWRMAELALQLPGASHLSVTEGLSAQAFFEQLADQQRGGLERNYQRYLQATGRQEDHYRQYRRAGLYYAGATSRLAIIQRQGQAWNDYLRLLTQRGRTLNPWNLPLAEWQPVRFVLREQMNVPVNDLWRPEDRRGFNQAVASQVRRDARNTFAETLQARINAGWIEPGLTRTGFLAVNGIQAQWRQDLDLPASITLFAYLTEEAFDRTVYQPALQYDAREMIKLRVADSDDLSTLGRDSYRDLVTPGICVLLILCGLAVHLFRTLSYLLRLVQPQPLSLYLKLLALYVVVLGSLLAFTGKARVPAIPLAQGDSESLVVNMAHGALQRLAPQQPQLYAWGDDIRRGLLGGYGFGTPASQDD